MLNDDAKIAEAIAVSFKEDISFHSKKERGDQDPQNNKDSCTGICIVM